MNVWKLNLRSTEAENTPKGRHAFRLLMRSIEAQCLVHWGYECGFIYCFTYPHFMVLNTSFKHYPLQPRYEISLLIDVKNIIH